MGRKYVSGRLRRVRTSLVGCHCVDLLDVGWLRGRAVFVLEVVVQDSLDIVCGLWSVLERLGLFRGEGSNGTSNVGGRHIDLVQSECLGAGNNRREMSP